VLARDDRVFICHAVSDKNGLASFANGTLLLVRCSVRRSWLARLGWCGRHRRRCASATTDVERDERLVDFQDVADVAVESSDCSRVRTRQFHRGFGGLDVDQRLVEGHDVADLDLPGHDLRLGQTFADIGQ